MNWRDRRSSAAWSPGRAAGVGGVGGGQPVLVLVHAPAPRLAKGKERLLPRLGDQGRNGYHAVASAIRSSAAAAGRRSASQTPVTARGSGVVRRDSNVPATEMADSSSPSAMTASMRISVCRQAGAGAAGAEPSWHPRRQHGHGPQRRRHLSWLVSEIPQQRLGPRHGVVADLVMRCRYAPQPQRDIGGRAAGQDDRQKALHPGLLIVVEKIPDQPGLELDPAPLGRPAVPLGPRPVVR